MTDSPKPPLEDIVAATSLDPAALAKRIANIERMIVNWQRWERTRDYDYEKSDGCRLVSAQAVFEMQRILTALDYVEESK